MRSILLSLLLLTTLAVDGTQAQNWTVARPPGGAGNGNYGRDGITGVGLDAAGNCYVAGHYNTDATFDTIKLSSTLTYEAFVAKYDSAGNAVWARSATNFGALHIALGLAADR